MNSPHPDLSPSFAGSPFLSSSQQGIIRILVVDDQQFIRKALQLSLDPEPDFTVVGEAGTGRAVLPLVAQLQPDIVLLDIEMPDLDGLTVTKEICQKFANTKVVVLSGHDDENYIRRGLNAGAKGYLIKGTPAPDLFHIIRFVHKGYLQLGPGLFEKLESANGFEIQNHSVASPKLEVSETFLPDYPSSLSSQEFFSTLPEEDWSDAAQEQIGTLPKFWAQGLVFLIFAFVAIIVPWAIFSKFDEVATARGRLEPQGKTLRLDAPVSGTVSVVHVKEGQQVKKGQRLLELQSDLVNVDLLQAQSRRDSLKDRLAQFEVIRNQSETTQQIERLQRHTKELEQNAQIKKIEEQIESQAGKIAIAVELLDKDRRRVKQYRNLGAQGVIPKTQAEEAERVMIQNRQQLQDRQTDLQQTKAELVKQKITYQKIVQENRVAALQGERRVKELQNQILDINAQVAQAQSQIKAFQYQKKQRILYASTNGTIFQLPIQNIGAVIQSGQTVAQIAPQNARITLRAQIDGKNSGFLKVGLPVKVKVDAYPFQDYGIVPGYLSWIAPDSKANPKPLQTIQPQSAQSESFELEIELAQSHVQNANKQIALKFGQTASAEILIRERRAIDLFLDPFKKLRQGGVQL